jgi:regulation of enolase protein 1 (concanavalin A-like superfamily)
LTGHVARPIRALIIWGIIAIINSGHAAAQTPWSLPAPWSAQDIGSPAIAGTTTFDQGRFTISAAGTDIWGRADQLTFVYQQVTGDVDLFARVDSVAMASNWSKAGVMIRNSLAANSAHGVALVSAGKGVAFQRRRQDGGLTTNSYGPNVAPPQWVRLVRLGTSVTAYSSADGSTWSVVGSSTIGLGSTVYVGLAATSHNAAAATTAVVSQVAVVPLSLPASQQAMDIGAPAITGTVAYRQGVYTDHAAGTDIWGTSDQFHFVYQPVSGDVEVTARVASVTQANLWSKTGVMIRETLTPDSRHAFALSSAAKGYGYHRRVDTGGLTQSTSGTAGVPPGWVRLVRTGSQIEAFQSPDGTSWTSLGVDTIPMAETVYVGLATTSHDATSATDAVIDSLTIKPAGGLLNLPPLVALTAPLDGSTYTAASDIAVSAAASDADGTISSVVFFAGSTPLGNMTSAPYALTWWAVPAGTYSLTAVATDNDGATTTSPAVSIRVDPGANQPPTSTLTAPANGATYTAPATVTMSATASDADGTIARVEFYNGPTLLNTDTTAPYAFTWSSVPAGTYGIRAIAYDNSGASATPSTASITVTAPANQPPTATLTAPANGATYTAPATVTMTATASDADGTIARVEFYNGPTLLNTDTTAPYAFTWSSVPAGTYGIRAIAYDNSSASATSATATITVSTTTTSSPTGVVFQASVDHASLVTRYELRIFASGADPATATPITVSDLGKPTPDASNDIAVDRAAFFSALAPGSYVAAVAAIGTEGTSISSGVAFTR